MKKRIVLAALITAICVTAGCKNNDNNITVPKLLEPVGKVDDTAKVIKGDISNTKIFDAQVIPYTEEIGFESEGIIKKLNVKLGDEVKQGDVLAVLEGAGNDNEYEVLSTEIERLEAEYSEANLVAEYDIKIMETEKKQFKKKNAKKEAAQKQADIDIAEAKLAGDKKIQELEIKELNRKKKIAYERLQRFYLKASIDGVITCIKSNPGDNVSTNEFVLAVSDNNILQIKSDFVSKKELGAADSYYVLYRNKKYGVIQHEYDPEEIEGMIAEKLPVYSYFDLKSKDAEFDVGESLELYVASEECKNTLIIPANALYVEDGHNYVYLQSGDNKVKTEVAVGIKTTSVVQITDGVKEGDVVYVKE